MIKSIERRVMRALRHVHAACPEASGRIGAPVIEAQVRLVREELIPERPRLAGPLRQQRKSVLHAEQQAAARHKGEAPHWRVKLPHLIAPGRRIQAVEDACLYVHPVEPVFASVPPGTFPKARINF